MLAGTTEGVNTQRKSLLEAGFFLNYPGDDLLSHTVTRAVPSALKGLTSVFGKGTGVAPSLEPPETLYTFKDNDNGTILSVESEDQRSSHTTN